MKLDQNLAIKLYRGSKIRDNNTFDPLLRREDKSTKMK